MGDKFYIILLLLMSYQGNFLVTGGTDGIGKALALKLLDRVNSTVTITGRNKAKFDNDSDYAAIDSVKKLKLRYLDMDMSDNNSIEKGFNEIMSCSKGMKFVLINNAGIVSEDFDQMIQVNLYGLKKLTDLMISANLLEKIVSLGSGSGPNFVSKQEDPLIKKMLCDPLNAEWEWIDNFVKKSKSSVKIQNYGLSKACLHLLTGYYARTHPNILSYVVTPGFVDTNMTANWGASKTPEQATEVLMQMIDRNDLVNGAYYGSDGLRSPYHFMRNPGETEYDGIIPSF